MLRKRSRSHQKDQQMGPLTMSDSGSESDSHKTNTFFTVPGLFVGSTPKFMSDCDSVRSPTSPLDFRFFSIVPNSYRSLKQSNIGHQNKSWDSTKVGLSILNSLDDDYDDVKKSGKVLRSSESKNILFGQSVRNKTPNFQTNANSLEAPKSLPRNFAIFPHTRTKSPLQKGSSDVIFEIGEAPLEPDYFAKIRSCSLDSCKTFSTISRNVNAGSGKFPLNNLTIRANSRLHFTEISPTSNNILPVDLNLPLMSVGSGFDLSASEIELSEDYTCVISHGPNPKKTHIYGDRILQNYTGEERETESSEASANSVTASPFPSNDFLNFCHHCNKKLDGGKDIYMYRGEKAFCSLSCRGEEIMFDEEMEQTNNKSFDNGEEHFENGIFEAP